MLLMIFSHLAAITVALALSHVVRGLRAWHWDRGRSREFWRRQNRAHLAPYEVGIVGDMPVLFRDVQASQVVMSVLNVASESGLLALLDRKRGATIQELGAACGLPMPPIESGLEVLMAANLVDLCDNRYSLNSIARPYLREDSPFHVPWLIPGAGSTNRRAYGQARTWLRGGKDLGPSASKWVTGKSHRPLHWAMSMHAMSFPLGFALASSGLIEGANEVLDVAGGAGSVCVALALKRPALELDMIELPDSIAIARRLIGQYELGNRIRCLGMDMFRAEWPRGYDAIMFTNILHDWPDQECAKLLAKAFTSLRPGGRVMVQEALLYDDRPGPLFAAAFSMGMVMAMSGRQFRRSALCALLMQAGFSQPTVTPLLGPYSSIVASR